MFIKIKDVTINYIQYGKGQDIILLHGWGQNIDMMAPIGDALKSSFRITIIDLPGFGKSSTPSYSWTLYDYHNCLVELVTALNITNPIVIGHSFGGRLAIIYAANNKVTKLVLLASPFEQSKASKLFKVKMFKSLKKIPLINKLEPLAKKYIGSHDYRNASTIMRQILVNTINEDLTNLTLKIKAPTLLIWGSNDQEVSLEKAKKLEKLIPNCGLVVYEGLGHFAYLENINQTITVLNCFFNENKK